MVKPKKYLGQHFLNDEAIAQNIVESLLNNPSNILEIGPGTGVLSKYLFNKKESEIVLIEIDNESVEYLLQKFPMKKDKIILADFLRFNISSIFENNYSIIGNFPYNISSQILFNVFENKNRIDQVVGMFQLEVANRICSPPGKKTYGILSVLLQAFFTIENLFTVDENCFTPPPKVKSAVIRLTRNNVKKLNCDEKLFKNVVKAAFNQRRKMLRNGLSAFTIENIESSLYSRRAETLSVEEFVFITNNVKI